MAKKATVTFIVPDDVPQNEFKDWVKSCPFSKEGGQNLQWENIPDFNAWVAVASSNIAAVQHDGRATLQVKFTSGAVHKYESCPPPVFQDFLAADSKGSFFAAQIKGKYPSGLVTPAPVADDTGAAHPMEDAAPAAA